MVRKTLMFNVHWTLFSGSFCLSLELLLHFASSPTSKSKLASNLLQHCLNCTPSQGNWHTLVKTVREKLSKKCVGDILSMKLGFIKSKCWDLPLTGGRLQTNKYLKQSCINVLHHNLLFYQTPKQIYVVARIPF